MSSSQSYQELLHSQLNQIKELQKSISPSRSKHTNQYVPEENSLSPQRSYTKTIMQLTKELENALSEKESISNISARKISDLNNRCYQLENRINDLELQLKSSKKTEKLIKDDREQVKIQYNNLFQEMNKIRKEANESYDERVKEYEKRIEQLDCEKVDLQRQIDKFNRKVVPKYEAEINDLKVEREQLYHDVEALGALEQHLTENTRVLAEKDIVLNQIKEKYKELKHQSHSVTKESDRYMDVLMSVAGTVFNIEDPTIYTYDALIKEMCNKYSTQMQEIKQLTDEIKWLKESFENLRENNNQIIMETSQIAERNNELLKEKEMLMDPNSSINLRRQILDSQEQIQQISNLYKQSVKELKKQQNRCQNMYSKLLTMSGPRPGSDSICSKENCCANKFKPCRTKSNKFFSSISKKKSSERPWGRGYC